MRAEGPGTDGRVKDDGDALASQTRRRPSAIGHDPETRVDASEVLCGRKAVPPPNGFRKKTLQDILLPERKRHPTATRARAPGDADISRWNHSYRTPSSSVRTQQVAPIDYVESSLTTPHRMQPSATSSSTHSSSTCRPPETSSSSTSPLRPPLVPPRPASLVKSQLASSALSSSP